MIKKYLIFVLFFLYINQFINSDIISFNNINLETMDKILNGFTISHYKFKPKEILTYKEFDIDKKIGFDNPSTEEISYLNNEKNF